MSDAAWPARAVIIAHGALARAGATAGQWLTFEVVVGRDVENPRIPKNGNTRLQIRIVQRRWHKLIGSYSTAVELHHW